MNDDSTQIKVTRLTMNHDSDANVVNCKVSRALIDDLKRLHGVDALAELKKLLTEFHPGKIQNFEIVEAIEDKN